MALTQDELGIWYDDGEPDPNDFTIIDPGVFTGGTDPGDPGDPGTPDPTPGDYGDVTNEDWDKYRARIEVLRPGATIDDQKEFNTWATAKGIAQSTIDSLKTAFKKPDGSINWTALGGVAGALSSATGIGQQKTTGGYAGSIPNYAVSKAAINYNDPNRRPGSGGRDYFTAPRYATNQADLNAANTATAADAQGILSGYKNTTADEAANPYTKAGVTALATPWAKTGTATAAPTTAAGASSVKSMMPTPEDAIAWYKQNSPYNGPKTMASGGILNMAKGRYLQGPTDGMADKLPAHIDNDQPAALSHGEFVVPADVVSHLGNGNSDAGAKKLYQMMDRIREARTGTKKQGKQINPDKFMPGGIVGYASGGGIQRFVAGGTPADTSTASTLSPWVGDYVTSTLGKGQALADQPYQAYKGPLTAGPSNLQQQAFAGASNLATTGYTPTTYTGGTFDATAAQQYMNPYLSSALNPQLQEQQRVADIARVADAGRLTQAGAYGGGRQAIMESEGRRNLLDKQSSLIGQGYNTAYDKAMAQYNADQQRRLDAEKSGEASRQYSANYGRDTLKDLAGLGATQRDIEQQGIDADEKEFEKQRDWDKQMQQYKMGLLDKLPISTAVNTANTNPLLSLIQSSTGTADFLKKWNEIFNPTPPAK